MSTDRIYRQHFGNYRPHPNR
ncbi:Protein of unknown function [Lactobacillus delbrueckii subsp. bulgaricus]|nr:Protein of unknown function [Lactobacillus delbrueckii subsp. bulgaricus]